MALHRDFMMRMIEKLSQAFFRIMAGKSVDDPQQAKDEIEDLISEALGTPPEFVLGQGPAAMETLEAPLAAQVGRLLMLHADLSDRLDDGASALRARRLGLHALMQGMRRPAADCAKMAAGVLRDHVDVLSGVAEAKTMGDACLLAHDAARDDERWDDAEDWLFWALEVDPGPRRIAAGGAFYDFLETLDEDTLSDGGLSASEIANARADLEAYR